MVTRHVIVATCVSAFRMVRMIGDEFLTEERDRKYYADHYTCCPPPLFIILITLVEVSRQSYPPTRNTRIRTRYVRANSSGLPGNRCLFLILASICVYASSVRA